MRLKLLGMAAALMTTVSVSGSQTTCHRSSRARDGSVTAQFTDWNQRIEIEAPAGKEDYRKNRPMYHRRFYPRNETANQWTVTVIDCLKIRLLVSKAWAVMRWLPAVSGRLTSTADKAASNCFLPST